MNISITCRHEYKTNEVKNYAQEKVKKLGKFFKNITKIEIVMDMEKDQHSADALISVSRGTKLVGRVLHEDPLAAIDLVIDKMERQLVRFKERLKDHRGSRRGVDSSLENAGAEPSDLDDADSDD